MFYVAYGSNLHPVRLSLRLPESRFRGTATIAGRVLCFHKRGMDSSGKCHIATGDGHVHVAVYELNEAEKARLDEIEGRGYAEEIIELREFGKCFTYAATSSHIDDGLRPFTWYKELVLAGCEFLGFPSEYTAIIRDIDTIEDPDTRRHVTNMRIVEIARNSAAPTHTRKNR
jgi:gamma-glutamylcyclotransferase